MSVERLRRVHGVPLDRLRLPWDVYGTSWGAQGVPLDRLELPNGSLGPRIPELRLVETKRLFGTRTGATGATGASRASGCGVIRCSTGPPYHTRRGP